MNCTRKFSFTSITMDFSFAAIFVILMTCSFMVHEPLNFMVVNVPINVPTNDLSAKSYRDYSSTNFIYSFALSTLGIMDLMLFATIIYINIKLSLFNLSQASSNDLCSMLLELVIAIDLSIMSAKSRSKIQNRN